MSAQQKARLRKTDLDESLQEQQYYADANEAESWMKEKEPLVANKDYGKDQDSAQVCLRRSAEAQGKVLLLLFFRREGWSWQASTAFSFF